MARADKYTSTLPTGPRTTAGPAALGRNPLIMTVDQTAMTAPPWNPASTW